MKKLLLILVSSMFIALPCMAEKTFHIEVVQVGETAVYERAYDGVIDGLAKAGLVKGHNLEVERTIIESVEDPGFFERLFHNRNMNKTASSIADKKPDLVITIGAQATSNLKEQITEEGIPLVFTAVSSPEASGLSGKGFTGVSIVADTNMVMDAALIVLPKIKTVGIIHSSETGHISDARQKLSQLGLNVLTTKVDTDESIIEPARQLMDQGIDAFFIPVDPYYENPGAIAGKDLIELSFKNRIPCISEGFESTKGSLIYLSPDYAFMGDLTAKHVVKILEKGISPDELPIVNQDKLNIVMNANSSKRLGTNFLPDTKSLFSTR